MTTKPRSIFGSTVRKGTANIVDVDLGKDIMRQSKQYEEVRACRIHAVSVRASTEPDVGPVIIVRRRTGELPRHL